MLELSNLRNVAAVANRSEAMEADTISKHGRISKSQMSRRNQILSNSMKRIDSMTFGKGNCTSPLINEECFSKLQSVHTYLKDQGVKPEKYDTVITACGSCGMWSSKQKCS